MSHSSHLHISGLSLITNVKANNTCTTKLRTCHSARHLICISGKTLLFTNTNIMGMKTDKKIIRERLHRSSLGATKWLEPVFNLELWLLRCTVLQESDKHPWREKKNDFSEKANTAIDKTSFSWNNYNL